MFFQQDGCPAYHAVTVRNWLNSEFNEHWIGRDGHILWPPRSPDLTILDFYLWGRLKQIVYREPLENDEEQLKTRIQNAVESLNVCHTTEQKLDFCSVVIPSQKPVRDMG
ncbi:hypothetical protein NQ318_012938 [Aromia moschata]|uniref:Transposable element Tc3 transposase n=1 Tax=Aromia moschata TaxID=1265417 RepID=A0AAV8XRC3_9CUCU|nr:hypothetical protein NQ318_012938 [Aromia moschata]